MRGVAIIFLFAFLLVSFVVSAQICDYPIFEGNGQCISVEGNPKCLDAECSCSPLNEIEPLINPNGNELTASMCCPLGNDVLVACTLSEINDLMHPERGRIESITSEQCGTLNDNNLYLVSLCAPPESDCHITNNVADCCITGETWNEGFEVCEPNPIDQPVEPELPELPGGIIPELPEEPVHPVSVPTDFVIVLAESSTILSWNHPLCEEGTATGATGLAVITGGSVIDSVGSFFSNIFNKIISAFSKNIRAERVVLPTQYFIIEKEFNSDVTTTSYITECTYTDEIIQGGSRYRVEAMDNDVESGFTEWRMGFAVQCLEEGDVQGCDTGLLGACNKGAQTCSDNIWGECIQVKEPTSEICDNHFDDDCDGYLNCEDVDCVAATECGGLINIVPPENGGSNGGGSSGGGSGSSSRNVPVETEVPPRRGASQLPIEEPVEEIQQTVQNVPSSDTSTSLNLITILLITLGVLIVAAGTLLIVLRKKIFHKKIKEAYSLGPMNENRLRDYIMRARSQGVTPKEIKNSLQKAGWKEEDIDKFLS